jgi:hypothetical protein
VGSKKFKRKLCAYCGAQASTADHVFAREFFTRQRRNDLIKVPACIACNDAKSRLEHYLTAILPFGGRHVDALAHAAECVPARLARNARLGRELRAGSERIWAKQTAGILAPALTLPLKFEVFEKLFALIARALAWHHWGLQLTTTETFATVLALTARGEQEFERQFFAVPDAAHVRRDLGDGTFVYEGMQATDNPLITIWRIRMYGGLTLGSDPRNPEEGASLFGVMTGPLSLYTRAKLQARFGLAI